jgi:hypothetical protein
VVEILLEFAVIIVVQIIGGYSSELVELISSKYSSAKQSLFELSELGV